MQLRVGEGGLCLEGAVVVPAEEDEQGRDDEDEASGGAHVPLAGAAWRCNQASLRGTPARRGEYAGERLSEQTKYEPQPTYARNV